MESECSVYVHQTKVLTPCGVCEVTDEQFTDSAYNEEELQSFRHEVCKKKVYIVFNKGYFTLCKADIVDRPVYLTDPAGNRHVVWARAFHNIGYLCEGVSLLAAFYNLNISHSITFTYIGDRLFHIHIKECTGFDISYPQTYVQDTLSTTRWSKKATSRFVRGIDPLYVPADVVETLFEKDQTDLDLIYVGGICMNAYILSEESRSDRERYLGRNWYEFCKLLEIPVGCVVHFRSYGDPTEIFVSA